MVQIHPSLPIYINSGSYLQSLESFSMRDKVTAIIMASCFLLSGCIGGEEAPSLIDISVEMEGASGVIHFVKDPNNGSSVEEMQVSFE